MIFRKCPQDETWRHGPVLLFPNNCARYEPGSLRFQFSYVPFSGAVIFKSDETSVCLGSEFCVLLCQFGGLVDPGHCW